MIGLSWKMYREANRQDADIYQFHHPDLIPAGLLLLGLGAATLWKTRKLHDSRRRRSARSTTSRPGEGNDTPHALTPGRSNRRFSRVESRTAAPAVSTSRTAFF